MQRLTSELQRLFLLPGAGDATTAALQRQLAGQEPAAVDFIDAAGRTRLMRIGFAGVARGLGVAHCAAMLQLGKALIEALDLPEPVFSVDGRDGFTLWLPLSEPVPVADAAEFLRLLQEFHLKDVPALNLSPGSGQPAADAATGGVPLPPGLHPGSGLWSVFIAPGLAPSFSEEAGIDIPPNLDKQAELLAKLTPIAPPAFAQALQRLRERGAPAAGAGPNAGSDEPAQAGGRPPAAAPALPDSGASDAVVPASLATQRDELLRVLAWPVAAVSTPFPALTSLLHGGFRGGRLYVLLAPPKAGKTTLAALALDHAAARGHAALYVGYEMAREQLVHAALARRLRLDASRIEARSLTPDETTRVTAGLETWLEREGRCLTLWEAGPATGLAEVAVWARRAVAADPGRTPLVVIDPLPLVATGRPALDAHPDEARRLAGLAAACKDLARSSGAAVLALCPAGRPAETALDPGIDRETRALWSAADGMLALHPGTAPRPDVATQDGSAPTELRLSLLSHRGRTGVVTLRHWPAFHAMEEVPLPVA